MNNVLAISDLHWGFSVKGNKRISKVFADASENDALEYIILAGDSISHQQEQWDSFLHLLNRNNLFKKTKVLISLGNHDIWHNNKVSVESTIEIIGKKIMFHGGILLDNAEPFVIEDKKVIIFGQMGCYGYCSSYPGIFNPRDTNDNLHMPMYTAESETNRWLEKRALKILDLELVLMEKHKQMGYKIVYVIHHPMDRIWKHCHENIDLFLFGHMHMGMILDGVPASKYIALAGDYAQPKENWLTL